VSWLSDSTELVSGGWLSSAYEGHGVRGDQVPSTGVHGAAPLYQHVVLPGDAAAEFRWVPSATPGAGTFVLNEDSSCTLTGAPDGVYALNGQWFKDGVLGGTSTNSITIGDTGAVAGGALITVSSSIIGGSAIGGVASVAQGASIAVSASIYGGAAVGGGASIAQGALIQVAASIQGGAASSVGGAATAQGAQITVTASIRGGSASNGSTFSVLGSLAGTVKTSYPRRPSNRQSGRRY
jgi:hypothetical protein